MINVDTRTILQERENVFEELTKRVDSLERTDTYYHNSSTCRCCPRISGQSDPDFRHRDDNFPRPFVCDWLSRREHGGHPECGVKPIPLLAGSRSLHNGGFAFLTVASYTATQIYQIVMQIEF